MFNCRSLETAVIDFVKQHPEIPENYFSGHRPVDWLGRKHYVCFDPKSGFEIIPLTGIETKIRDILDYFGLNLLKRSYLSEVKKGYNIENKPSPSCQDKKVNKIYRDILGKIGVVTSEDPVSAPKKPSKKRNKLVEHEELIKTWEGLRKSISGVNPPKNTPTVDYLKEITKSLKELSAHEKKILKVEKVLLHLVNNIKDNSPLFEEELEALIPTAEAIRSHELYLVLQGKISVLGRKNSASTPKLQKQFTKAMREHEENLIIESKKAAKKLESVFENLTPDQLLVILNNRKNAGAMWKDLKDHPQTAAEHLSTRCIATLGEFVITKQGNLPDDTNDLKTHSYIYQVICRDFLKLSEKKFLEHYQLVFSACSHNLLGHIYP